MDWACTARAQVSWCARKRLNYIIDRGLQFPLHLSSINNISSSSTSQFHPESCINWVWAFAHCYYSQAEREALQQKERARQAALKQKEAAKKSAGSKGEGEGKMRKKQRKDKEFQGSGSDGEDGEATENDSGDNGPLAPPQWKAGRLSKPPQKLNV